MGSAARLATAVKSLWLQAWHNHAQVVAWETDLERATAVPGGSSTACLPSFQHLFDASSARFGTHHPTSEQLK